MSRLRIALDLVAVPRAVETQTQELLPVRFAQALTQHAPKVDFLVLSRPALHAELAYLDAPNVARVVVPNPSLGQQLLERARTRLAGRLARWRRAAPPRWPHRTRRPLFAFRPSLVARLHTSAVFCPFTTPQLGDPLVPLVAALSDLRHLSHPHLLTSSQRAASRTHAALHTSRSARRRLASKARAAN